MMENRIALLELIEKIEQLGEFQDRIEFPSRVSQIWTAFLADVQNLLEIEICALFLVSETTNEFVLKHAVPENMAQKCRKEVDLQIECGLFSWIINRRQPALVPALAFDRKKSIVMLPVSTVKNTLGAILILTSIPQSAITHETIKLLRLLTKEFSLALENTRLVERLRKKQASLEKANREIKLLSRIDPLTGCYNRGYLNEMLPREIARALRYKRPLALAMCDLDNFKKINDTHGHQCGDEVLKKFVLSISAAIRTGSDWLARYGGEEFLVVLPETHLGPASSLADRLRKIIADQEIEMQTHKIPVTASFGVTGFNSARPPIAVTAEALIQTADRYLYQAKIQGRNRVISGGFDDQA